MMNYNYKYTVSIKEGRVNIRMAKNRRSDKKVKGP